LPMGVTHVPFHTRKDGTRYALPRPYTANIMIKNKCKGLGHYSTPEEASAVYQAMKFMLILVESALSL
jgi:hypothetical protein